MSIGTSASAFTPLYKLSLTPVSSLSLAARSRLIAARLAPRTSVVCVRFASARAFRRAAAPLAAPHRTTAPIAALALALSGSIAFAAATKQKMTDSPVAVLAEEHFQDKSYDRTKLYEDLKTAHAGTNISLFLLPIRRV
jgi:hypothetical protein